MPAPGTQTFYFGDSLTDVDVIFSALVQALAAQILPSLLGDNPTPEEITLAQQQALILAQQQAASETAAFGFGPENAVTNAFTHANYTADVTGDPIVNLANAGARALGIQEPLGPGYDSNLGGQLARFAALPQGAVAPGAQAIVFIGSNDFADLAGSASDMSIFGLLAAAGQLVDALLETLEAAARSLDAAGIETVYFGTLPASSFFPASDAFGALELSFADATFGNFNARLAETAANLRAEGLSVEIIDYAAPARAATEDPSGFGITAARSEFLLDGAPADSDQVAFWDPIHPTEVVHQAWGAYAAHVLAGGSTDTLSDFGTISTQDRHDNAVFANGGNDIVFARAGDDVVFGGTGNDSVFGGKGDDIASGGAGNDVLRGQRNDDILAGGLGDDRVLGGAGSDVLIDGLGNDIVRGGAGDDAFIYVENVLAGEDGPSSDQFNGGSGADTLYLVLSEGRFDSFEADGASAVLAELGISTKRIESVVAIDGRDAVETVLGEEDWFQKADFWGLVPNPESTDVLLA